MPSVNSSIAQTVLVVSVVVFLITGLISFVWLLMYGLKKWREEQNPPTDQPPTPPKSEASPAPALNAVGNLFKRASSGSGGGSSTPGAHEVLRVARDNLTGRLLVEVAGQRFAKLSDITDPTLAQAVLTTLHDLQAFAGTSFAGTPTAPLSVAPPPTTVTVTSSVVPMPVAPTPTAPPVTSSTPVARPPAPPMTSAEMPPIPKPSMNPFKQAQVLRQRAKQLEPIQLKSIPEIIDEYLQQKLLGTPHIWRGIRVRSDAKGAVVFEVDGLTYDAVDTVPDEEVRTLIKGAIAEWDAKR
jgi:hypothetical protein